MLSTPVVEARYEALSADQNAAIHAYVQTLARVRGRAPGASVEQLFAAAERLDVLTGSAERSTSIEYLAKPEFERLQKDLPGIMLQNEEAIRVQPLPEFFEAVAAEYGDAVDKQFAREYAATFIDTQVFYLEMVTDVTGCTRYGMGLFAERYGAWTEFRAAHPRRYRSTADALIENLEEELLTDTCACGTRDEVVREYELFIKRFPSLPLTKRVGERLRAIENGSSDFRYGCSPS
jgi:hypothetical protein